MNKKTITISRIIFSLLLPALLSLALSISFSFAEERPSLNNNKIKTNLKDDNSVQITAIQGVVQVQKVNAAGWIPASQGTKLYSQDKIRTLIDSLATLQYPDNTQLTLRENSILTIQDTSKDSKTGLSKRELKLDVGGMKYKVTRLTEKGSEFKIHTSTAIVGVTGTEGNIENGGEGKPTKNTLTEGTTYNTDASGKNGRPLNAGNSWEIDVKARSEKHMATPEETNNNTYKSRDPAVEQRFNDFMKKFNQKKDQGYDMAPLAKLFEQILEAVSKNDSPRLNPLLDEAEKLFGTLKKFSEPKAQEINALIQSILQDIETKKKEGYDLSQVYSLLAQAQTAYQEEKYSRAEELLEQVKHALTTIEKKADDFKARLTAFEDELNNKAKDGFIVNELIEITKQIKIYFDSGAPAQAEELLNKAKEMLAAAKRQIPGESLKNLEDIKAEIADRKKDGFDVADLKELILLADKAVEENEYLKLEELLTQIREKLRMGLTKPIPENILLSFNTFEETLKKKQAAGFDLLPIQNLIKSVYDAKEKADFAALRTALTQAQDALLKLAPPEQLLKHFQELKNELKKKQDAGYEIKEIEGLITQAQTMLDKGAISDIADLFLQIETALNTLKDTQPPLLQAGDLIWADGDKNVTVSGIAKDNIKIAWVSVNGGIVNLDANGNFQQNLILTPLLKEIIVESQDTSGNPAPEIRIPIAQDKLDSLTKIEDTTPPELKTENIRLTYIIPDELKIEGKSEANALITINGRDVLTDNQGVFSAQIKADKELVDKGLSIIGRDAGGNSSPELKIPVPDKWPPVIHAVQTELSDQIPPSLKVNTLVYEKDKIKLSGSCEDIANIIIKVEAEDIGSEIKEYSFNTAKSQTAQYTLMLTPDLKSVDITVSDKQDNITNTNAAIDFFLKPVIVMVNEKEIKLDKEGFFSTEIIPQADMQQIIISAKDSAGNEATPVKLAIADIIPPTLTLGDLAYSRDSVEINGKTDPYAIVTDKSGRLFSDKISTNSNGIFKIKIKRPEQMLTGVLIAEDASGNRSQEVNVTIEPLIDNYPPRLTVANLEYKGNKVTVSGSSEDDTGIKSVTINNQAVELQNNIFSIELELTPELTKAEVTATDLSGKITTVLKVVEDNIKPEITLEDLSYDNGYCLVKGSAADNIGLKEVRVNNIPVPLNLPEGGNFEYPLPISAELKEITAAAVDLYGNFTETPPKTITLPADNIPPTLTLNELTYGSPIVIVSGVVKDNVGIKQVLVNGLPVNLYEDGSFKTQIAINFSTPALSLNDPIYDNGMVTLSGRVNPGIQDPREIIAQAEDLSGNKSETLKKQPQPFQLEDIKVLVNDQLADLENGSFSTRIAIEKGMTGIKVSATDPFGNAAQEQTLPLEKIPPIIEVNEPQYADNNVTISGTAKDTGAGIAEVLINAASVPVGNDGKFSQTFTINGSSITIVAIDRLGNMATAPPIKLTPSDKAAPVFILKVTPMPAIIGKSVFIGIDALDSKTRLPEILSNPPEVKVTLPNAQSLALTVNGQGASFNTAFDTTGLTPGSVNITIKGVDSNGNIGDKIEGISTFLLNTQDSVPPTLKITLTPPPPVIAGTNVQIMLTTSETLKTLPKTEIGLPGGTKFELNLEGSLSGTLFSKNISLPQDLPPGDAIITAAGAVDLAGNTQTTSEEFRFFVRPQTAGPAGGLILRLEAPEITPSRVSLKGITAPGAIVHLNAANMQADIPADDNGRFNFMRQVSPADLDNWPRLYPDGFIPVNCFSTNYAGLKSETINLKFPLPKITAEVRGALVIETQPDPVEQGKPINILIKTDTPLNQPPRAVIKFIDGRTEPLSLTGAGKEFSAVYPITMAARPGPAIIEVRTEKFFQARPFMIIPFGPAMMAGGFYNISANPDPAIIGKDAEFFVRPQRPIDKPPRLQIRLPNGRMDNIALSGEGLEFRGKYLCPANMPPGPAELIINDGEYRRPYGISSQPSFGPEGARMFSGLIAYSNPSPMLAGAAATITVKSDQYLNFMPKVDLRLTNGRLITTGLSGTVPGNNFSGQVSLPMDAPYGPATIVLRNERNEIIGEHPANIAPAYAPQAGKEVDVIMSPFSSMPGQSVNITVTSRRGPFTTMPQAKLIFSNSLVFPLRLEGNLPTAALTSTTNIPPSAAPGPVSINVIDENGRPIGNGQGMIGTAGMGPGVGIPHGEININLMPPYIIPGNNFEIQVYSPSSLYLLPKVSLDIPGKGTKDLRVDGQVPGNSFRSQSIFPRDAKVRGSRIDLRFDRGTGEETRSIFLEGGGEEERRDFRPPQLTPWPPIPGQPLMLTLYAPGQIDFVPIVRVNYYTGQNEPIPISGPVPGDTFSGTLGRVIMPLRSLDIFDPRDNRLLISLPIEMFSGYTGGNAFAPPILKITPAQPLMPPVIANIAIKFSQPAPMIPRVNVQLPDGRNINVFVNGAVPGTFFNGMLQIPPDCPSGQAGVQVYLGDQPIPGMPSIMIGGGTFNPGDILNLKAFPNGPVGELAVDWLIMPNAMKHRLSYQAPGVPGVPGGTKDLGRIGHYILQGLRTGIDYQIMLTAYDQGGREFARSELDGIRLPETNRTMDGFPADASNAGPNSLQINWEPQFNATNYELHYALSPADPMTGQTRPLGSTASYILSGLANGTYRIIIEAVFAAGERKKSREATGTLGGFNIGNPPKLTPNPPVVGQPLEIQITTPMIIPVIPKLGVKYITMGEDTVILTGAVPGSSFTGRLPLVKEQIAVINIYDPYTNELKYSYPVSTSFIPPVTLGGPIPVTPLCPRKGDTVNVPFNTSAPQPLQPYVRFFFTGQGSQDMLMFGQAGGTAFNYTYTSIPADITRIEIRDNGKANMLGEFTPACGASTGNLKANISTTPDPPIIGTYTAISVNIVDMASGQPANVSTYPQIYADFMNGRLPLPARGSLPGSTFNGEILAVNFTSQLRSITVEHNGLIIGQRPFGSTPAPGPGPLGFSCNNPYAGQEVRCIADVPLNQPAITAYPQMRVFYPAGTSPLDELMAVTGNLPGWHFEGVVSQAKNRPDRAELKLANGLIQTFYFGSPIPQPIPFDPPCPTTLGQPFNYCVTLPSPQAYPPYMKIYFKDNSPAPWERLMTGSGTYFCVNTEPLSNYVDKFELLDNGHNKLAEKSCGVMFTDCWNINVNPDPPRMNEPCVVNLTNPCGRQLSMVPNLKVTFSTGNKDYPMNGSVPGTNFTYTIPAGDMTTSVTRMEGFENNKTTKLPGADRNWNAQTFCPDWSYLRFEVRPCPYSIGQTVTLVVDLPTNQPYISTRPTAKVYYNSGKTETISMPYGVLPGWNFQSSFIAQEKFDKVDIDVDMPTCAYHYNYPVTCSNTDYPRNPWPESTGPCNEQRIHWDAVAGAGGYDIYYQPDNPTPPYTQKKEVIGGNITSEVITGLFCGKTYYFYVTVHGETAHETPKSFPTIINIPVPQTLEITDPANGDIYFGDVSRGSNSADRTITIKNNKTTAAQIKRQQGSGQLRNSPAVYFSETDTHFTNFSIQPGNSGSTSIYISVPSTATSGTYGTNLILYDDANGNNVWDNGETIVKTTGYMDISLALRVQGELNITPPAVLWGNVSPDSTTSLQDFHIGPTGADLVDIKVEKQPLYLQGGGSIINGNNINVNLGLSIVSGKVVLGSGQTSNSTISVSVPSTTMIGTYHGNLRIYHDVNNNGAYDSSSEPSGTLALEVSVASPSGGGAVDHFTLSTVPSGITTNPVGKPVLIKVTAYTSTDDTTIATSFSSSVAMSVSGSNYILSLQDRVSKNISQLQISNGMGYCTIDAVSAASLGISVSGYTSNTLSINFTTPTCSDLSVKQLAVDFERETVIGGISAIQVFTVTDYGKMAANYTGTINFIFNDPGSPSITLTKTSGGGTLSASPPYTYNSYNFVSTDYGNASFELKDTEGETIPFSITDTGNSLSASGTIRFTGVEKFIVEPARRIVQGNSIQLTAWAATNGERKLSGYNNSAVSVTKIAETGGQTQNSASVPATIAFSNGNATFTVSETTTDHETVTFEITDGSITSGIISVRFASTDTNPPVIDNVKAETPFLIYLHFTEDIDSENAMIKANYTGVGTINKVCWYGNEVTLHLASALTLGDPLNIDVNGSEPNGIKDNDGNYMGNATKSFTVPSVDYQGSSYGSGDWLEIQAAPAQVSTGSQTIKITIIQKNACGYLTGSNAVNKSTTVSNVNLTYTNTQYITGLVSSQSMSDGRCEFNLTTNFTAAGQTITVTAAAGGVTSGTATITSQ